MEFMRKFFEYRCLVAYFTLVAYADVCWRVPTHAQVLWLQVLNLLIFLAQKNTNYSTSTRVQTLTHPILYSRVAGFAVCWPLPYAAVCCADVCCRMLTYSIYSMRVDPCVH
jgi:hypothetical protein